MAVRCGIDLQMRLVGGAGAWTSLAMKDLRTKEPLVVRYGVEGSDPTDRVASAGELTGFLNNGEWNAARVRSYYSPLHASKRVGFDFNIEMRLLLTYAELARYKFRGSLADIIPDPGPHEERLTSFRVLDWFDDAARIDMPDLPAQLNKRGDELMTLILDAMTTQPVARDIEVGVDTFALSLDGASGQGLKVRERINQICQSEWCYCYSIGDDLEGGTVRWENRQHRSANPDVLITLTGDDLERPDGIAVPGSRDDIYRTVQVFAYPTNDLSVEPDSVLYSLEKTSTVVLPGQNYDALFGPYRDETTRDQIGGTDEIDPVPTTDYEMNSAEDGSGVDLTANFTVVASFTGEGVRFTTIQNNGPTPGYIVKLQVRGKAIRRNEAISQRTVAGSYGDQIRTLVMPFQNNMNVAADVATFVASTSSTPFAHAPYVRFFASKSDRLMRAAILREPGDRIAVSEPQTGLDAEFTINSVELEIDGSGYVWCRWGLEPASATAFWVWGEAVMGVSTVFGF